jgi:hypothetical protein
MIPEARACSTLSGHYRTNGHIGENAGALALNESLTASLTYLNTALPPSHP